MMKLQAAPVPVVAPTSRPVAIARALAAIIGALALVAGTPVALSVFIGNPLPSSVSWDAVKLLLTRPDTSGDFFLRTLATLGWILWLTLVISIVLEVIALAANRPAPRLGAAFSVQQQVAAGLIGAIAVMFFAPASFASAATPTPSPAQRTAVTAAATAGVIAAVPATQGSVAAPQATESSQAALKYVVKPGDSLWSIAEAQLGDGNRYGELVTLNIGVAQPDGDHLDDSRFLRAGWILTLPADAGGRTITAEASQDQHVVAAGESIWSIAEEAAGPGATNQQVADLTQRIVEESRAITQAGGEKLQDPNRIQPGWHLNGTSVVGSGLAADGVTSAHADAAPDSNLDLQSTPETDAAAPSAAPSATPSAAPSAQDEATGTATAAPTETGEESTWPLRTIGGVGALLAAGVLSLIAARRARQQRRRLPGQRIAMPDPQAEITELKLRAVENPRAVERVDTALRGLALWLHENDQPLPALNLARLSIDRFQLHLEAPAQLPEPWIATSDPTVWALACDPDDVDALDTPRMADGTTPSAEQLIEVPAPYPSLTVIGQDLEGTHILLDLEQLVALSITGDVERSEQILRALAIELATSVWADDLRVTLVGCCPELPAVLGSLRLRHLSDVEELLRDLEGHTRAISTALSRDGLEGVQQARVRHQATDATAPEIVLLADPITPAQRDRLDEALNDHPRLGLAAVTAGVVDIDSWTLSLDDIAEGDDEATATLEELSLRITPQRVDDTEYASLLKLLKTTAAPAADVHRAQMPAEQHLDDLPSPILVPHNIIDLRDSAGPLAPEATDDGAWAEAPHSGHPVDSGQDQEAVEVIDRGSDDTTGHLYENDDADEDHAEEQLEEASTEEGNDVAAVDVAPEQGHFTEQAALRHSDDLSDLEALEEVGAVDEDDEDEEVGATVTRLHVPLLRVLGTVDVINAQGVEPSERGRVRRGLELAILIAFFPGLDHRGIDDKLSPNKPLTTSTRNRYSWAIRKLLGTDENGDNFVPNFNENAGFRYELHPAVRTDWHVFQDLVAEDSTASLLKALRLVRGAPFSGIDARRYVWAEGLQQEIVSTIVDVAYTVATRALAAGRPGLAREAAALGRRAEPGSQVLWRATLRADHLLHDHEALSEHADRVSETNDDDLEPETTQLLRELLEGPLLHASAQ